MDPAFLCKLFFSVGTAVNLGGILIPSFRQRIMNYGSRSLSSSSVQVESPKSLWAKLIKFVASFQVPHTWFTHYYLVSVVSSVFWAVQICTHGRALEYLAAHASQPEIGMTVNQVCLAWCFMMVQGTRRLYECITLTKPSKSKMWVGLWLLGIAYYVFMGISIWIEGIAAINVPQSMSLLEFSEPSTKTLIAVPIFIVASGVQNNCHKYLASLKKYTLPGKYLFQLAVCPHYTSECLIYVAIAIISAPKGQIVNKTLLAGMGFVFSNLAVTADSTRNWYADKFGAEKLKGRWRMVPYLY